MLQGPVRTWEGQTGQTDDRQRRRVDVGQVHMQKGGDGHLEQAPAWPPVVVPMSVSLSPRGGPEWAGQEDPPFLSPALIGSPGTAPGTTPSQQPPTASAATAPGPRSCPYPGSPPPRPVSFSVLISQSCTRRALSMGEGVGSLVLLFCWFNLIICKVMFLFLFTLFSSYLTSVWKKRSL